MNTKLSSKILLTLLSIFIIQSISSAQGMIREIPLKQQIKNSSLVVEGKVISSKVVWNEKHNNIYTVHTVEVYKVFKGEPVVTIEVITHGGTLDFTTQTVTPSLNLNANDIGVFTLYDNNILLDSKNKSSVKKYKPYSSLQGFYKYNFNKNIAVNPFKQRKNISKLLYNEIGSHTKSTYKEITPFDIASKVSKYNQGKGLLAPDNIVFTPTTITAGNVELLTITGTGFGSVKGKIGFSNADDGGGTFVDALDSQVITWSDTEITVQVPSGAGTGTIKVTDNGGASKVSNDPLTISYALQNSVESGTAFLRQHVGETMDGEMTWKMNTRFNDNTAAKESFLRAFEIWRCATGINWVIGGTTTVNEAGLNDDNVITFDDLATVPLDDGVLGECVTISGGCSASRHVVPQLDIIFNDDVDSDETSGITETWYYGADAALLGSDNYDFESVALHELGHGHQLGHVINTNDVMHYSLSNGQHQRALNTNNETAAGIIQSFSTSSGLCGQFAMTNYSGDCGLSVEEKNLEGRITIYPNPAKNQFYIKNESFVNLEKAVIYDISGRLIYIHNFSDNSRTLTIRLTGASKGVYFVNIHSETTFITKKLILE
ncbi:T9SS type A sorting domain-containing protein [Algibacter agarivorans]